MIKKRKYQVLENEIDENEKVIKLQKISTFPILKESDLEELINNIEKLSLIDNEVSTCDTNDFNNFFTDELEEQITKKTIISSVSQLNEEYFSYKEKNQ